MKKLYSEHLDFFKSQLSQARLEKIEKVLQWRTRHLTIVLEDTHKTHNISAVMRNAECFGIQDLHLIEENNKSVHLSPYVAKKSDKWLTLHHHRACQKTNAIGNCLSHLKACEYQLIALSPHAEENSFERVDLSKKTALLMGKEISGLSPELMEAADHQVKLPMFGFSESFNLSVATALCLQIIMPELRNADKKYPWPLSEQEKEILRREWVLKSIHKIGRYERAFDFSK